MLLYLLKGVGISLLLTLILEMALAVILKIRGKSLIPVALVNVLTNPVVVLLSLVWVQNLWGRLILEAGAVAVEGAVYYLFDKREGYSIRHPFLKSLILNVFSYGIGIIINHYF